MEEGEEQLKAVCQTHVVWRWAFVCWLLIPSFVFALFHFGFARLDLGLTCFGVSLALPGIVAFFLPFGMFRKARGVLKANQHQLVIERSGQRYEYDWYAIQLFKRRWVDGNVKIVTASGKLFEFIGITTDEFNRLHEVYENSKGKQEALAHTSEVVEASEKALINIRSSFFFRAIWFVVILQSYLLIWAAIIAATVITGQAFFAIFILFYFLFGSLYFGLLWLRYHKKCKHKIEVANETISVHAQAEREDIPFNEVEEIKYHWLGNRICIKTDRGKWHWLGAAWPKDFEALHEACFVEHAVSEHRLGSDGIMS